MHKSVEDYDPIPPTKHSAPVYKKVSGPSVDLKKIEAQLANSISTVGSLVAAGLSQYKQFAVFCHVNGTKVQIPPVLQRGFLRNIKPFTPPVLESTLGHVIVSDAPVSANVIMGYASKNPTLLKWVEAFNKVVHLEGTPTLLADHLIGTVSTLRPENAPAAKYFALFKQDVLMKVMEENQQLQVKVEELQNQIKGMATHGVRDERGSG